MPNRHETVLARLGGVLGKIGEDRNVHWSRRLDGDPEWVEDLVRVLNDRPDSAVMLLTDIASETIEWIVGASTASWDRNARGLLEEFERACAELPRALRICLGPRLNSAKKVAPLALRALSTLDERASLREALSALIAALAEQATVEIAWDALINSLRDQSGSIEDARHAIAGLYAVNRAIGAGESMRLAKVSEHVRGTNIELRLADPPCTIPDLENRLQNARALLAVPDHPAECVVWISIDRVSVPHGVWSHGPLSLYQWVWAVPNAREDNGQLFTHRDELRELMRNRAPWGNESNISQYLALARVELPSTPPSRAWDVAEEHLRILWQTASRRGALRWVIGQWKVLLIDGASRSQSWSSQLVEDDVSPHRIHDASDFFIERAPKYIDALTARPLPALLREALRSVEDIDLRESLRPQNDPTPLDERISLTLRLQAAEHVAQWIGLEPATLIDRLVVVWATGRPINRILEWAWTLCERDNGDLRTRIGRPRGLIHIDLALDHEPELLALCDGPLERAEARRWFAANRSAKRYLSVVAEETRDLKLIRARHQRIRNAIVHGSPVNAHGTESVRAFARSMASSSIKMALDAHLSGDSPIIPFDEATQTAEARLRAAEQGRPPVDEFRQRDWKSR